MCGYNFLYIVSNSGLPVTDTTQTHKCYYPYYNIVRTGRYLPTSSLISSLITRQDDSMLFKKLSAVFKVMLG